MANEQAIALVCKVTGYDPSEISDGGDAQSLELWDSIAHVNIIMTIEALINRPLSTNEIIDMTSIEGIQNLLNSDQKG